MTTKKKMVKVPAKASSKTAKPKVAAKTTKTTVAKKAVKQTPKKAATKTRKPVAKNVIKLEKPKARLPLKKSAKSARKVAEIKPAPVAQAAQPQPEVKKLRKAEMLKLKEELIAEQSRLVREIDNLDNITHTNGEDDLAVENRSYSIHMAENASENEAINMALGLRRILLDRLEGITDALERLEKGNYGICAKCGCAIELERLLAKPQAVFCVECRRQVEKERRGVM